MRFPTTVLLACLLALSAAQAGDPPDPAKIRVPSSPSPVPGPGTVLKLSAETIFVIDSDEPVRVLASPQGVVKVTKDTGPLRIRGRFIDGGGSLETRTYSGKFLYFVEPVASGRVELLVVPTGAAKADDADVIRRTLDVDAGDGPRPPPEPKPPEPKPPDPVNPAPIPADGFRVLIVYDREALGSLPPAQNAIFHSAKIREYTNVHCVKGPDGATPEFRQYAAGSDLSTETRLWRDAFARPRGPLPWIVISTGKTGYEGPLPADTDKTLDLLKKYGGN